MVKVDMVHENTKNLKLEVAPDETTLTLWDAVTRMVRWRRACIDVDEAASASTTPEPRPQSSKTVATTMTHVNPKYAAGKAMLSSSDLHQVGQYCADMHNFYINNHKMLDSIMVAYKKHHFLQTSGIFVVSFRDLYDIFNLLDISLIRCFTL
jgi:hypothetical protein